MGFRAAGLPMDPGTLGRSGISAVTLPPFPPGSAAEYYGNRSSLPVVDRLSSA
jgi:hypothetical protein